MSPPPHIQKVVIYCVDDRERLLVLRHLDFPYEQVGLQVPAGTVEPGEDVHTAAHRELCEETGQTCFAIDRYLGSALYNITPMRPEIHERHFFAAHPTAPILERWESFETHAGLKTPTRFECFWIPLTHGHVLSIGQGAMLYKMVEDL
jgi:8-oxo-dGTP pyrophosphatase MutT (NUDIX family)